jgi:FlaA1/EpsC-like NDP-sugar epimerase
MVRSVYPSVVIPSLKGRDWCDFLARPAFESPPPDVLDAIFNVPILIPGAGGSIGSALAVRLVRFGLPALFLLESAEHNLYELK